MKKRIDVAGIVLVFVVILLVLSGCRQANATGEAILVPSPLAHVDGVAIDAFSVKAIVAPTRAAQSIRYSTSTTIPFSTNTPIVALSASGTITRHSTNGYVRAFIVGNGQRILIFSSERMPGDARFSDYCSESCAMAPLHASGIELEIKDADVTISSLSFVEDPKNLARTAREAASLQQAWMITNLKSRLAGGSWTVGDTTVSRLPLDEKEKLVGSADFDESLFYYQGGLYVPLNNPAIPAPSNGQVRGAVPSGVDWRNRHGKDWITPPKSQMGCWVVDHLEQGWDWQSCQAAGYEWRACGSCWAHSVIGSLEAAINIRYNMLIDADLSEQDLVSCSSTNGCEGGNPNEALDYISQAGVTDEACFPFAAANELCSEKCLPWQQRSWKVAGYQEIGLPHPLTGYDMKTSLINEGPCAFSFSRWNHAMTLIGFGTIVPGVYWPNGTNISADDPLIGKTYWIMKNSWGQDWGEGGFGKFILGTDDYRLGSCEIPLKPTFADDRRYAPVCEDNDHDGFCWWGLGTPKPSTCPASCRKDSRSDCDDHDPSIGVCASTLACPDGHLLLSGETIPFGDYYGTTDLSSLSCCGDDLGESIINGAQQTRCCDSPDDFLTQDGRCHSSNECSDDDGGIQPYTKGTVEGWSGHTWFSHTDECDGGLTEWYCNETQPVNISIQCPDRPCASGACPLPDTCHDSDNGKNYAVRGYTIGFFEGSRYFMKDHCIDDQTLGEEYCDGNLSREEIHACGPGKICSGLGACVN